MTGLCFPLEDRGLAGPTGSSAASLGVLSKKSLEIEDKTLVFVSCFAVSKMFPRTFFFFFASYPHFRSFVCRHEILNSKDWVVPNYKYLN